MKTILIFILSLFALRANAQDKNIKTEKSNDNVETIYGALSIGDDEESFALDIDRKSLTIGRSYRFQINGVNDAHMTLKVSANSKELYYTTPDLLKSLLPNIVGSSVFKLDLDKSSNKHMDSTKIEILKKHITALRYIKKKADELYSISYKEPNAIAAINIQNEIQQFYKNSLNINCTKEVVQEQVQHFKTHKVILENLMRVDPIDDIRSIEEYSSAVMINDEVEKNDYLKYYYYIEKSTDAKSHLTSKGFIPKKDLVEVRISLIDTFKADTIYNEVKTFYTKGNFSKPIIGLGFSTGFFYTSGFADPTYYVTKRDDETVNVIQEKKIRHDVSIGALAHLYLRVIPEIKAGISVGLSVSPFDGKSHYHFGPSVLLGREKLIGISAGLSWAKSKELSAKVSKDSDGWYMSNTTSTVPTIDKIRDSYFISLTYNIVATRK